MTTTVAAPDQGVANDQTAAQSVSGHGTILISPFSARTINAAPYTDVNTDQNAAKSVTSHGIALIVSSTHSVIPAPFFGAIAGATGGGGQAGYATGG